MLRIEPYMRDLTAACRQGELAPVYGLDAYLVQAINALSSKSNSALLVSGPPGCGMRSLVRAIVFTGQNTIIGQPVLSKRILELRTHEFPDRAREVRHVLEAAFGRGADAGSCIYYIPELRRLLEETRRNAPHKAVREVLEESLENQAIKCIFTLEEGELARFEKEHRSFFAHLHVLPMQAASSSETRAILKRVAPGLGRKYRVPIHPKSVKSAQKIAEQYVLDAVLPGAAIRLLDQACARYCAKQETQVRYKDHADRESMWHMGSMVMSYDVKKAASEMLGVDVLMQEMERWNLDLYSRLSRQVFGQDEAIGKIVTLCGKLRNGVERRNRVSSAWLLEGPSHVGKTQLAHALARELLGSKNRLIKIDLSKCRTEQHLHAALWEGENALAKQLQLNPFNIVLLRKMGYANEELLKFVNYIFGNWTQAPGRSLPDEFRKALFLFAVDHDDSGHEAITDVTPLLPFGDRNPIFMKLVPTSIPFRRLTREAIEQIIDDYVENLNASLMEKQIRVELSGPAMERIVAFVLSNGPNTRGIAGQLTLLITQPIQDFCAENSVYHGDCLRLHAKENEMLVRKHKVMEQAAAQAPELRH
ncbi:MAG: ATP-dependent Clp protease ATP-binding subunit [Candidatus Hydrogenedentes bacterium]|nr:ATP-dependent Clp protease ATP-binding subunit [Candidatus Hydrogenedentota bacterium]